MRPRDDEYDDEDEEEGRPRKRQAKKGVAPWVWAVGGITTVMLMACCGGGAFLLMSMSRATVVTYTPVTADQLIAEWKQNPVAAAEKYRLNGVEMTGTLHKIDSNISGQTYIDVRGSTKDGTHIFVLNPRAKQGLAKSQIGSKVLVKARAEGDTSPTPWLVADEIIAQ